LIDYDGGRVQQKYIVNLLPHYNVVHLDSEVQLPHLLHVMDLVHHVALALVEGLRRKCFKSQVLVSEVIMYGYIWHQHLL
jgi:hypothetical protein